MGVTVTAGGLIARAWSLFRHERTLLIAAGAPFLFLAPFAVQLLADPPPMPVSPSQEWMDRAAAWTQANGLFYVGANLIGVYGIAVLALLLAGSTRPTVGEALPRALAMLPRFLLAAILVAVPVGFGLYLLILPGLYIQARLAPVPLLLAGGRVSAAQAVAHSWRLTAPAGWALWGAAVALFAVQWFGSAILLPLDGWLRGPAHANPLVLAMVDAALAALHAFYRLAVLLLGAAALRPSSGT